jgi:hypothetical protein
MPDMYSGMDGFLGTRASLAIDVVLVASFAVLPVLAWSVWLVRVRRNYQLHKRVQLALLTALLLVVTCFELDMRFGGGWRPRAEASPYFASQSSGGPIWDALFQDALGFDSIPGWVTRSLAVHLVFSVTTLLLWLGAASHGLRRMGNPPQPGRYGSVHRFWGWCTIFDTLLTAISGAVFYWLAFVCC